MLPDWDDKYSIGNHEIDAQHQKLFELAKKAYILANKNVSRADMKGIINEFFAYMKEHFSKEEEYMQSIGYPELSHHTIIHKEIVKSMAKLITETKNVNEMKENLIVIAKSWLLEHIIQEDMKIEDWHRKNKDLVIMHEYICGCEGKIHQVPHATHLKIAAGKQFVCTKCNKVVTPKADD